MVELTVEATPGKLLPYPVPILIMSSPLLEEERYSGLHALVPNVPSPLWFHGARAMPAFSTGDHPVDVSQVQRQGSQQRLTGQEAHGGGHPTQIVDARGPTLVLHRNAHPDVAGPRYPRS